MSKNFDLKILKSNIKYMIIGCILTLLFIYIATNFTTILRCVKDISNDYGGLLGFFGSIIGGFLGFLGALWGVNYQKKIHEKHEKYKFADSIANVYGFLYLIKDHSTKYTDALIKEIYIPFIYDENFKKNINYIKNPIDKLMIVCLLSPFDKNIKSMPLSIECVEPYLANVLRDLGYDKSVNDIQNIYSNLKFIDNTI